MLFNSIHFIIFFPIVTIGYYIINQQFRWLWLLVASCIFYMVAIPEYILIIFFTIIVDYFAGIWIENSAGKRRKQFLILSLIVNIGTLFLFKYTQLFFDTYRVIIFQFDKIPSFGFWSLILPIGLSFHTFQAMSYTIEVYRGNQKAERHLGYYALYVMFYPQMVAGPIERPQNILHQFYEKHVYKYKNVIEGFRLMAWGLIKKVVIADRLSPLVDAIYHDPTLFNGLAFVVATFLFSFQIYCDFSGYSDIALGAAKTIGFDLMKNFDRPYFSTSIAEFWRKWHISLSTWFRDYLYIPLGGNKGSEFKKYFNLSLVFLISGLWHGNTWCFVLWGGIHAFYQIFGQKTIEIRTNMIHFLKIDRFPTLRKTINILTVFVLVSFAWIFFRAMHTEYGFFIVKNMFVGWPTSFEEFKNPAYIAKNLYLTKPKEEFIKAICAILLLIFVEFQLRKGSINEIFEKLKTYQRWVIYYLALIIFLFFGVFDNPAEFIYFQF